MANILVEGLDDQSQEIIAYFIDFYKAGSIPTYKNAFKRIYEYTKKTSIKDLTIEDYHNLIDNEINGCVRQILKFLYAHDLLEHSKDFEKEFGNKEIIRKRFEKIKSEVNAYYVPALTSYEIEKLVKFVENVKENEFDSIRLAFCFYMLFYNQLDVRQLHDLDAKDFVKGLISLEEDYIEIPNQFHPFLEDLKQKSHSKFSAINIYITELGKRVGIDNLKPIQITEARKQRSLNCPECGNHYLAIVENWVSVNSYLMCKHCYESLRQTEQVKKNEIKNCHVNFIEKDNIYKDDEAIYERELDLLPFDYENFDSINPQDPKSRAVTIYRLVRDTRVARALKGKYNNSCQLCGKQLRSADGNFISEAHHIQPYNKFHKGSDSFKNLIILCPNHHAQFDQLFYAINPQTHKVHCLFNNDPFHLSDLKMVTGHVFGNEYLQYVWNLFCIKQNQAR